MPWMLLSNHGHELLYVDTYPDARLREIPAAIGITERAAHKIVTDLEEAGYISRERVGRRNRYEVHRGVARETPAFGLRMQPTRPRGGCLCVPPAAQSPVVAAMPWAIADLLAPSARGVLPVSRRCWWSVVGG